MILHLVNDSIFIDMAFRKFEKVYPNQNECILFSAKENICYIKTTPLTVVDNEKINFEEFTLSLKKYEIIIFHGLNDDTLKILKYLPKNIITIWIGYGFDYYDLITKSPLSLFDQKTKMLYLSNNKKPFFRDEQYVMIRILKKIKYFLFRMKTKKDLVNSITFFAPVLDIEYNMIQNTLSGFRPQFIDWNYGTLEDDLIKGFEKTSLFSNNILLGNSASYENNHLDAFETLSQLDLKERKIITPLSYGIPTYRDKVIHEGMKLFPENFMPLNDFIPINEYIKLISSCSIAVMYHIRQQAVGNIIIMMYIGASIFLKKQNPVYKFFKKNGAIIYTIDELEKNPSFINHRLTQKEIEINRNVLKNHWSRDVAEEKTRKLINIALEES